MQFNSVVILAAASVVVSVGGCAYIPTGKTSYYFPKATTQLVITQTLACNSDNTALHEVVTVTPTTTYTSDLTSDVPPYVITPKDLDGFLSDADVAFSFTDDGRLSGVNATTTGQGTEITKNVVAIAKAAGVAAAAATAGPYDVANACRVIASFAGKSKSDQGKAGGGGADSASGSSPPVVTLTYSGSLVYQKQKGEKSDNPKILILPDPDNMPAKNLYSSTSGGQASSSLDIAPDAGSLAIYTSLKKYIPRLDFSVQIASTATRRQAAQWSGASGDDVILELNSVATADLTVTGPVGDLNSVDAIWKGQVQVPLATQEDRFKLPVPKAEIFGTQKFVLSLSSYGSIDKLEYSKTGTSDVSDAAGAVGGLVAGALRPPTDAQRAAAIQAQADLIYQQQRLAICAAKAASCPSK